MKKSWAIALAIAFVGFGVLIAFLKAKNLNEHAEPTQESALPSGETKKLEKSESAEEIASRQKETDKMWAGIREFGNVTRIKAGNCWVGQYSFNDPKDVRITNDEWEVLMKVFCFLQGQEYQCEQLMTMESPLPRDLFLNLLSEEKTAKLLGEDLLKAIRYDTEREIEYHGVTLSKLNSIILLEKKFGIVEHESGACENEE
jgi:hypothetical protein